MTNVRFITVEGIDGAGKTTVINDVIIPTLNSMGFNAIYMSAWEFDGGQACRQFFLDNVKRNDKTFELLYHFACRRLLQASIRETLEADENNIVVVDRYYKSTYAHQAETEQDSNLIVDLIDYTVDIIPDLSFYLEVSPEVAMERIIANRGKLDAMEEKGIPFMYAVDSRFKEMIERDNDEYEHIFIDANESLEEIAEDVKEQLMVYMA